MFGREFGSDTSSTRSSELEPHDPPGTENPEAPDDSSPTPPESSSAGSEDEDAVLNPE
jgi:hypothetical protein